MPYAAEPIARALKEAREAKGLSQRALARLAGVPQSHISKIEAGAVDLRLTSLIELARVLDLDLALVPRKTVPAVQSIARASAASTAAEAPPSRRLSQSLIRLQLALTSLPNEIQAMTEVAQLQRSLRDLHHFPLDDAMLGYIHSAIAILETPTGTMDPVQVKAVVHQLNNQFGRLRNALVHGAANQSAGAAVRPAYSLDDEGDDHA